MPTEWITTREAADLLGVKNVDAVSFAVRAGRIKGRMRNGSWRVTRQSVERYSRTRRQVGDRTASPLVHARRQMEAAQGCGHPTVYGSGPRAGRCTVCGQYE